MRLYGVFYQVNILFNLLIGLDRYASQYQAQMGTQYSYIHEEEELGFQLVDTSRQQKTAQQRANMIRNMHIQVVSSGSLLSIYALSLNFLSVVLQRKQAQKEREKRMQGTTAVPGGRAARSREKWAQQIKKTFTNSS